MPKTTKLRDETKYRLLPPLDGETYGGLKATIAVNGVQVPIVKDEMGYILDGFARAKIAGELGYECPSVTVKGLTEQEKRSQVRALNLARRHLDYAARREIIADELKENPDRSNRWIAKSLGVDHKTVARVRTPMGASGEVPQTDYRVGADGRYRPATRSNGAYESFTPPPKPEAPDYLDPSDEEAVLRVAAEIRQRRVAERLKEIHEQRQRSRPVRIKKGSPVMHGDCLDLIPTLENSSVSLVVTSPPYAEQRKGHYERRGRRGLP